MRLILQLADIELNEPDTLISIEDNMEWDKILDKIRLENELLESKFVAPVKTNIETVDCEAKGLFLES